MKRFGILVTILSAGLLFTVACNAGAAGADDYKQQPAKPVPAPRFSANSNGTVTDKLTGLIWLQDADCFGARDWDTSVSLTSTLVDGQCGLNDGSKVGQWRLPSREELSGLLNRKQSNKAAWLNLQGFSRVNDNCYWSSSLNDFSSASAWYIDMHFGVSFKGDMNIQNHVWPVRGGR